MIPYTDDLRNVECDAYYFVAYLPDALFWVFCRYYFDDHQRYRHMKESRNAFVKRCLRQRNKWLRAVQRNGDPSQYHNARRLITPHVRETTWPEKAEKVNAP